MKECTKLAISLMGIFCINLVYSRSMQGSEARNEAVNMLYNNASNSVNLSFDGNNFKLEENKSELRQSTYENKLNFEYLKKNSSGKRHKISKRNARFLIKRYNLKNSFTELQNSDISYERKPSNETLSTVIGKHKVQVSSRWKDFDVHSHNNGYKIIIKPLLRHEIEIFPEENQVDSPIKENDRYEGTWNELSTSSSDLVDQNIYPITETSNTITNSYKSNKYLSRKNTSVTYENISETFTHGYKNVQGKENSMIYPAIKFSSSTNSVSYELSSDEYTHDYRNKILELENSAQYSGTKPLNSVNTESYKLPDNELTDDFKTEVQEYENSVKYSGTKLLNSVNPESYNLPNYEKFGSGYGTKVQKYDNSEKYPGTKFSTSTNSESYKLSSDEFTHDYRNKTLEFENSADYSGTKPLHLVNTESYKLPDNEEFTDDFEIEVQEYENSAKYSGSKLLNSVYPESYKLPSYEKFGSGYGTKVQTYENSEKYSGTKPLNSVSTDSYELSSNEYSSQIMAQGKFTTEITNEVEIHENLISEDNSDSLNEEYTEVNITHDSLPSSKIPLTFASENIDSLENIESSRGTEFNEAMIYVNTEDNEISNVFKTTYSLDGTKFQNSTFDSLIRVNSNDNEEFNGIEASGFFPTGNSLEIENFNQDESSSHTTGTFGDRIGDIVNQLDGSGSEELSKVSGFEDNANRSGKIFNLFSTQSEFSKCTTPKGEPGHCRRFRDCLLSDALSNFNNFLQYLCLIRSSLVGICCPDNPVIEVTAAEPQNSTEIPPQDIKLPPEGCGLNSKTRIVGGKISVPHEWTWMVALMRKNKFYCGGVIINNWYVLTAAHCVLGINVRDLKVRLGEYNFNSKTDHQKDISVAEIKRHAQFVTLTFQHDIALLKLRKMIEYTKFVGSICLPGQEGRDYSDTNGTVVGWGTVSFGGAASSILREVTIPVWTNEDCDRTYLLERIGDTFLCAGSPDDGEDACQGDSGGPLMALNESGRWEVIGIVSWGRRCGDPTYPGVYTRVTSYLDWIRENAQ